MMKNKTFNFDPYTYHISNKEVDPDKISLITLNGVVLPNEGVEIKKYDGYFVVKLVKGIDKNTWQPVYIPLNVGDDLTIFEDRFQYVS